MVSYNVHVASKHPAHSSHISHRDAQRLSVFIIISVRSIFCAINCRELCWFCPVRLVGMSSYPNSQMHSKLWMFKSCRWQLSSIFAILSFLSCSLCLACSFVYTHKHAELYFVTLLLDTRRSWAWMAMCYRARVNVLTWWIGAGAGTCVHTIIWHTCGFKNLSSKFRFAIERFIYRCDEERHKCSTTCGIMYGGHCQ